MAGIIVIQYHEITYYNKKTGNKIAKSLDWCVRAGRQSSGENRKYGDIKPAEYTKGDLKKIYQAYDEEEIRGATPRYWEQVQVGDQLSPIVKGPLSRRDIYAWLIGAGSPFMRAHSLAYTFLKRHPGTDMMEALEGPLRDPCMYGLRHLISLWII